MRVVRWARLEACATCGLRLGAWYPVTGLTAREAQVQVRGRMVMVPRSLLELRATPSQEWTVVPPRVDPTRPLAGGRDGYVVCPNCRHRDTLPEARVAKLRCARCNDVFTIAWDEPYLRTGRGHRERGAVPGAGPARASREVLLPPWTTLAPDRRMTRRRVPADRRAHLERRIAERRVLPSAVMRPERRIAQRRGILNRRSGRERRGGIERRQRAAGW